MTIGAPLYSSANNPQQVVPPRQSSQLKAPAIETTSTPTGGQQYKQYTERLIGAINNNVNEASGYSIATSKSTQLLPPATNGGRFANE